MQISGTFGGLELARRGLQAGQRGLEVAGRNIAGAASPEYHRQRLVPAAAGSGLALVRERDLLLDGEYREAAAGLGLHGARRDALARVEEVFREPSDYGIQAALDRFWNTWQQLAGAAQDPTARAEVLVEAGELVRRIREAADGLAVRREALDRSIGLKVQEANDLAGQLADLNLRIATRASAGGEAADLEDRRDALLDRLARLAGVSVFHQPGGQVTVYLGGEPLVQGGVAASLTVPAAGAAPVWSGSGAPVRVGQGELGGELRARDQDLALVQGELDRLATELAARVNQVHAAGYGLDGLSGRPFFLVGAGGAQTLALAVSSPEAIAAAAGPGASGDGENAAALAGLRDLADIDSPLAPGQPLSVDQLYRTLIGRLGLDSRAARDAAEAADLHLQSADRQRQSVIGVSADEETLALVQHQKAVAAAARVTTALDEALEAVVNRMGLVGR